MIVAVATTPTMINVLSQIIVQPDAVIVSQRHPRQRIDERAAAYDKRGQCQSVEVVMATSAFVIPSSSLFVPSVVLPSCGSR